MSEWNRGYSVYMLCYDMFPREAHPEWLPFDYWAGTYDTEVIIYGLLEALGKYRRTPGMTNKQLANFASTVMERKDRESRRNQVPA